MAAHCDATSAPRTPALKLRNQPGQGVVGAQDVEVGRVKLEQRRLLAREGESADVVEDHAGRAELRLERVQGLDEGARVGGVGGREGDLDIVRADRLLGRLARRLRARGEADGVAARGEEGSEPAAKSGRDAAEREPHVAIPGPAPITNAT